MSFEKRKLTPAELGVLHAILPAGKPAYAAYRRKIEEMFVIGAGRFGSHNLILGNYKDEPDFTLPSTPVFSFGEMLSGDVKVESAVHEEEEMKIEIEIIKTPPDGILAEKEPTEVTTLADFSPFSGSSAWEPCRKVELIKGRFYLSFLIKLKKIILTDSGSGYNALIPVSNFYNELMFVKNIRDPKFALNPRRLFDDLGTFSDTELASAFAQYNKLFRRADIKPDSNIKKPPAAAGFFKKLFKENPPGKGR